MATGLSWNTLIGNYIVFVRDSELSHKIFSNVRPDGFCLIRHPFGKALFGKQNMIMMMGDIHKDLRRRLTPLFTYKALGLYVDLQVGICEELIPYCIERMWQLNRGFHSCDFLRHCELLALSF